MDDLTFRENWRSVWVALAVEYGGLALAFIGFWNGFLETDAGVWGVFLAFGLAASLVAMLVGWCLAARVARDFSSVLIPAGLIFAPALIIGWVAFQQTNYILAVPIFAVTIVLTVARLNRVPGRGSADAATVPQVDPADYWHRYVEPHRGRIGEIVLWGTCIVVVMAIFGAVLQKIHAPVTEKSLLTSVLEEAPDTYSLADDRQCFTVENGSWTCQISDRIGGSYSYLVTRQPGSSCWSAVLSTSEGRFRPPVNLKGCVHRFAGGWGSVIGS